MILKNLFKTKAERRAYAIGRRHQYFKENPKKRYGIETTTFIFNADGSLDKKYSRVYDHNKFKTKKEASEALIRANANEVYQRKRVLEAARNKKVNVYDSNDCQFDKYRLVNLEQKKAR